MRQPPAVLGVDIGTSSTKGLLVDPDGKVLARALRVHNLAIPSPGRAEMDALGWRHEVMSICRELTTGRSARVEAVCVSGIGPCLVLCDDRLRPLRPAILYGIDTRAGAEIEELMTRYGHTAIVDSCGSRLSTQAVGPKMLWVNRHEPEVWAAARRWYNSHTFVLAALTGEYVMDHHTASQSDPLYDMRTETWSGPFYSELAGDLPAPNLVWPGDVVGSVTARAAEESGLSPGTPVVAGTVDAWVEAFGAGVRRPGDAVLMYASTLFLVEVTDSFVPCPPLWSAVGVERGTSTLAAGTATAGSVVDWLQRLAGGEPIASLVRRAEQVSPGADGVMVLPYFSGERTPIFDPDARGVIAGLSLLHGRGHLLRAVYEGIAYGVRQIVEAGAPLCKPPDRVTAVGGGIRSNLWMQIVSDVTGLPQRVVAEAQGASYGDALLGAIGVGLSDWSTDWSETATEILPDPQRRSRYDEGFSLFEDLYQGTKDVVHRLSQNLSAWQPR